VSTDPYEQFAEQSATAALRANRRAAEKRANKRVDGVWVVQSEKDAPMKPSAAEQDMLDQSQQMRMYRRWQREQVKVHLTDPYGEQWLEIMRVLSRVTLETGADELVAAVRNAGWLKEAPMASRVTALSRISNRIIWLRVTNGLAPIDDAMPGLDGIDPGEPLTVFELIRAELNVLTP
jgi:hypothetical protein